MAIWNDEEYVVVNLTDKTFKTVVTVRGAKEINPRRHNLFFSIYKLIFTFKVLS